MPRSKASKPTKKPLKVEDDKYDFSPAKKKRRSSSSGTIWRRKIYPPGDTSFPTLSISLQWDAPQDNIIPTVLQITDGLDDVLVTASDLPISMSFDIAQTLRNSLKSAQLIFNSSTKNELNLYLAIKTLPFTKAQPLVELIFEQDYSEYDDDYTTADVGWSDFFKELEILQRSRKSPQLNMQVEELKPILRDYQAAAVDWMLERERYPGSLDLSWLSEVADTFITSNRQTLMYNKYSKTLYPEISSVPLSSGGILADEMGLGKTVITLALLLHNKCNDFKNSWEIIPKTTEVNYSDDTDVDSLSDDDEPSKRQLNQEGSLNADEQLQLVPASGQGKGILRSKLQAWYESQLSGFQIKQKKIKTRNDRRNQFKCTCGDNKGRNKKIKTIKCSSCQLIQHEKCCGYKSEYQYVCPSCWRTQNSVTSQATLVIVPPAIQTQWANEIQLHAPSLKTFLYNGIRDRYVQPLFMADHDVVITTYTVLRAETLYTNEASERNLRNENRFLRSSSPLERVNWWRIVCDEAQLVESDLSLVRQMTNLLQATHRWCVTGTPIQRGVADLFYLTSFMGIGVFDNKSVWTDFLLEPYIAKCKTPLLSVLSQVFWRSTKEVVEASLPEQTFQLHSLKFSAIEEIFYMQQHALSAAKFSEGLHKSGVDTSLPLDSIDKSTLKRILQPLLNVRQACTHPQVVSGISISSASGAANLAELSEYLYKKAKQECEEALRCHVAALNGLAGLNWFSDVSEALECYRCVFRLAEECSGAVQVDTLQRIHALTNAALILQSKPGIAPPTLRDNQLQTEAEELEKKYLSKAEDIFASSQIQCENLSKEVVTIREDFESDPSSWWNPVILGLYDYEEELIDKLAEELHSNDPTEKIAAKAFLSKISTLRSVEITIRNWWKSLEKCYKHVKLAMRTLNSTLRKTLMEEALQCHLRSPEERFQCTLCSVERSLQDLECELFATTRKVTKKREKGIDGAETKGSWKAHNVERTLSTVFSFARGKINLDSWCVKDGRQHLKLLEAMKKEFKQVRAEWTALNHCIHAEDELTMAKQRIRLSVDQQPNNRISKTLVVPKGESLLELNPYQIPQMMKVFEVERDTALSDFNKKKGRMMYLQNLSKDRNVSVDPCPICKNSLEQQWCVLYCGHCLCFQCMQMLLNGKPRRLKCPVCREFTNDSDVSFVDITGNQEASDIKVIGDYSTKVDNIIRQVLQLVKEDATVKILIFSTWSEVLKILSQALEANQVPFVSLPSAKHKEILSRFLDKSQGVTALLLPLAWGSKGLNLIEATHVFLVEPILNPAEELQAIGRVHRIGQTRPTVVHRFIVNRTIEEKIFAAVSEAKDTWSNKTVTLDDLKRLFVIPAIMSEEMDL